MKNKIRDIWIYVTRRCNLNCKYCFVKKEEKDLNTQIIVDLLEQKKVEKNKKIRVVFYGGEPLIFLDKIKQIIIIFKKYNIKTDFTIITNGLLLNKKKLKYLKKNNITLTISIDGNYIQNQNRIQNIKLYMLLIKNILLAKKERINFQASLTINQKNYKQIKDAIMFLTNIGFKKIGLNPSTPKYYHYIAKKDILEYIYHLYLQKIFIYPFIKYLGNYQNKKKDNYCQIFNRHITIDTNKIAICPSLTKNNNINNLKQKYEKYIKNCKKCKYFFLCGGGCFADHLKYKKKYHKYFCAYIKKINNYFETIFKP